MRRIALAFLAFLMFSSACSGDEPTFDNAASREVEPVDAEESTELDADVADRLTVRLAVAGDWSGDPAEAGPASLTARVLADLLYEGLTRLDTNGQSGPALAERWFVSDDRLIWTFVLTPDLVDGAGEPITARDVKQSLERVAARSSSDQAAGALTSVTGWTDYMTGATGGVAGISAPDEGTLVIRLDTPFELLLDVLASPAFGITGETATGTLRTTGAFRGTDDRAVLTAVDDSNPIGSIELVWHPDGPAAAMAAGDADWAVLAPGDSSADLPADIIRQPLDLKVAVVARMGVADERLGVLGALEPLLLAGSLDAVTARTVPNSAGDGIAPPAVILDVPAGTLESLGAAIAAQLEDAGITVVPVTSDAAEFATRLAAGDALVFPVIIAGGTGSASGMLRLATPGAIDDVFGTESEARAELAAAVAAAIDIEQRGLFADALERELIEDGYLLPVGRFEVRVAMGTRLDGLRHRIDGTLDLSEVRLSTE